MRFIKLFLFSFICVFVFSCLLSNLREKRFQPFEYQLESNEKAELKSFFEELLIQNPGVFTLWGSKPLTVAHGYDYTDEEFRKLYDRLSDEEKRKVVIAKNPHFKEKWENFIKIKNSLKIKKYLFFSRKSRDNAKIHEIFFVNIPNTISIIEDNYSFFQKKLGFNFNPKKIVLEIEDKKSIFWQKTFNDPTLMGILFGFGKENALHFYKKYFSEICDEEASIAIDPYFSEKYDMGTATLSDFPIPVFASFFKDDPVIKKYQKEREKIRTLYEGKNFLDLTLEKLAE